VGRLLEEHEDDLAAIEVVTDANGIFDVHVDGTLVFEKSAATPGRTMSCPLSRHS
jgi:predicted Rdx family selenoprotein